MHRKLNLCVFLLLTCLCKAQGSDSSKSEFITLVRVAEQNFPCIICNDSLINTNNEKNYYSTWYLNNETLVVNYLSNRNEADKLLIYPKNINNLPYQNSLQFTHFFTRYSHLMQIQRFGIVYKNENSNEILHHQSIDNFIYLISTPDFYYLYNIIGNK